MQYLKQTVTITHTILADEALTPEIQAQLAMGVRELLRNHGKQVVAQIGQGLADAASLDEEPNVTVLVTVGEEEITEVLPE